MQQIPIIPGIPTRLALDGFWLTSTPEAERTAAEPEHRRQAGERRRWLALAILLVIAAGDILFWKTFPALSLAIFAYVVFGVAALVSPVRRERLPAALGILTLGALPVIEYAQFLSVSILIAATLTALILAHIPREASLVRSSLRLLASVPIGAVRDASRACVTSRPLAETMDRGYVIRFMQGWAVPIGGCLVFGALIFDANPLLQSYLTWQPEFEFPISRAFLWVGIGLLCWPLLQPAQAAVNPKENVREWQMPSFGVNALSVFRALIAFNVLIGVQTLLDLGIFLGGAQLPEGMTYATYAHRGAYPLLATALLAGGFALLARPYLRERRGLVALMMLWLAQNAALCASALLRLDLYMDAYGLTYLRVRAVIWMVLVMIGLGLIAWQVWRQCPNRWLTTRFIALGGGTLYLCCFVNFAALIAHQNLTRGGSIDWYYTCNLPNTARGAIELALAQNPSLREEYANHAYRCADYGPFISDWRNWGFRKARVISTIAAVEQGEFRDENPDRGR